MVCWTDRCTLFYKNISMKNSLIRMIAGLLLWCCIPVAYAEDYVLKGVLMDSLTQELEPYATVRVQEQHSDKLVKAAVTATDGTFSLKLKAPGTYRVAFYSMGKQTVHREVRFDARHLLVDLGKVYLSPSSQMLGEAKVVAQRTLVKAEIDKLSYNVKEDPDAKTNTVLEMLRKVPMVTVDGEDKIQVSGSGNFKVYVDGKPNSLMSNNPSEVLKSLPATAIKSIEVITEPGAKYDAEGIGGILNIVTAGTTMEGYNVTLGLRADNKGVGGNGYGTVQWGKFTVSGNYSYNYYNSPKAHESRGREDFTSDAFKYLQTDGWSDDKGNYQYGNLDASYELDKNNLLTFSASLYGGVSRSGRYSLTQMDNAGRQPVYSYESHSRSKGKHHNVNAAFDYQHSFKTPGEYLTLSYRFDHSPVGSKADTWYEHIQEVPFDLRDQSFDNDAHTSEHTVQADYVNPFSKNHYMDAGIKYIHRTNVSDALYWMEQADGTMAEDLDQSTHFDQGQSILAAYADYQLKWKKLGVKAGVRYEHSFMDVKYALTPERNFDTEFDDVVPTANVAYMFSPSANLRANYNLRINRPSIWYLNPFRDSSDPTALTYGNPNLDTEKAHNVGLTYSNFSAKLSANVGLNYMFTNNGIEQYSFMNGGVLETTYANAGKKQNVGLSCWVNWNPTSQTRISLNARGNYSDIKSSLLKAHNDGFSGNLFANVQQHLPWELRLSAYGGGSTPAVSLQGKGYSYYYYGLSLNRSFLKDDRLNVAVTGNHLFGKYVTYEHSVTTESFHTWSRRRNNVMRVGVSISWRIGDLKAKVKETVRTINNDDVKSGGGDASAGGKAE